LFPFFTPALKVKAVLFAVESNMAALALQGPAAKWFMRHLNPLHTPPQNVPFMRMVRLLDLAFHWEYQQLIDDNVLWLGRSEVSLLQPTWTFISVLRDEKPMGASFPT
jgi:hypothetical protein